MSATDLIGKFEAERASIQENVSKLREREGFLAKAIAEMRKAAPSRGSRAAGKGRKAKSAGKKSRSRGRKPKGGMTVKEAILAVVTGAGEALKPGEIVSKAAALSGGAPVTVRTQITHMATAGDLAKVEWEGRGFKYAASSSAGTTAAPAKRASKKRRSKKKAGSTKKRSSRKKSGSRGRGKKKTTTSAAAPAESAPAN